MLSPLEMPPAVPGGIFTCREPRLAMRDFGLYELDRRVKVPDRSLVSALRTESGGFYSRIKLVQSEVPKNQQALPAARRIESSVARVYNSVRGYGLFDKKTGDTVTKI